MAKHEGIEIRHDGSCRPGGRCRCTPSYRASLWSNRDGKLIRRTFASLAAAKAWRADAQRELRQGQLRVPTPLTVRQAAEEWLAGADTGAVGDRSGRPYKPSTLRGYRRSLEDRVLPALGDHRLSDLRRIDVQALVDALGRRGARPGHDPQHDRPAARDLSAGNQLAS